MISERYRNDIGSVSKRYRKGIGKILESSLKEPVKSGNIWTAGAGEGAGIRRDGGRIRAGEPRRDGGRNGRVGQSGG
jgi:hypothetical protein